MGRLIHTPLISVLIALGLMGCAGENYELGVPYRAQEQFNYCVPASIQMWRLYDQLPDVSQTTIWNWIGGPPCDLLDVPAALDQFTHTYDAYADVVLPTADYVVEEIVARQITSIDRLTPVIAIVGPGRNHVGVVNGGKYTDLGTYYSWEFMYFNDPDPGINGSRPIRYTASEWLDEFCLRGYSHCGQAVSHSAISGWATYKATYASHVVVYGSSLGCSPVNCGPEPH